MHTAIVPSPQAPASNPRTDVPAATPTAAPTLYGRGQSFSDLLPPVLPVLSTRACTARHQNFPDLVLPMREAFVASIIQGARRPFSRYDFTQTLTDTTEQVATFGAAGMGAELLSAPPVGSINMERFYLPWVMISVSSGSNQGSPVVDFKIKYRTADSAGDVGFLASNANNVGAPGGYYQKAEVEHRFTLFCEQGKEARALLVFGQHSLDENRNSFLFPAPAVVGHTPFITLHTDTDIAEADAQSGVLEFFTGEAECSIRVATDLRSTPNEGSIVVGYEVSTDPLSPLSRLAYQLLWDEYQQLATEQRVG